MTAIYKFPTNWFSGMRLLQVNNDIRDLERKLSLLRKAIVEKDLPLKVAQTRLDERTRRMNLELTHDEPMQGSVNQMLLFY